MEENYLKKELYELIKTDEEIFDFIQSTALDGLWYWDLEKPENEWMNAKFWTTLGYSPKEMPHLSSSWQNIINQDDLKIALENFSLHLENGNHPYDQIVRYRHKNDFTVWIRCRGMAIRDENGVPKRMLGAHHDITEQKQAELELLNAKEKAEESEKLKSSFLQNMSHEVRTPLNAIVGFSQLMTKGNLPPEKLKTYSEMISFNSHKLIETITDVIEISEIQANIIHAKMAEIELNHFLLDIHKETLKKTRQKKIDVLFKQKISLEEFKFQTDPEKLKRILEHLLDNALKFTIEGSVSLISEISENNLLISVADTGIGIAKEMHYVIFEPFRQVETGITRNYGGNGLGLPIVKKYTELLNGTITVSSQINRGTTFTITLPIIDRKKPIIQHTVPEIKKKIKTIVIAEDEFSNYIYLVELMEEYNVKILYASNGQNAVDLCRNSNDVDLVMMDIKMPIMDGHTATKLIKAFRPELPIIAQTAYALEFEQANYIDVFDYYVTKPIDEDDLRKKLLKYMEI